MAKLKAPLLSLGASGAIGKAMVFFNWKGLDVVREYVIPANPKTTEQTTHRAILTAAVAAIHAAELTPTSPLREEDKVGYALYAATEKNPRTWFNQITGRWLIAEVKGEVEQILRWSTFTDVGAGATTVIMYNHTVAAQAGYMYGGTSKTSMPTRVAATGVNHVHTAAFTGLTKGVKYFFQFRPTKVTNDRYVMRSGIYTHVQLN